MKKLVFISVIALAFVMYQKHFGSGEINLLSPTFFTQKSTKKGAMPTIKIESIHGDVFYENNGQLQEIPANHESSDKLKILTYNKAFAIIRFGEKLEYYAKVGPNSNITVSSFFISDTYPVGNEIVLNYGNALINAQDIGHSDLIRIKTKNLSAHIPNTKVFLHDDKEKSVLLVNNGNVKFTSLIKDSEALVESGKGVNISNQGEETSLSSSNYQINWNEKELTGEIINYRLGIDRFIQLLTNKIENLNSQSVSSNSEIESLKMKIDQDQNHLQQEMAGIQKDQQCMRAHFKECQLDSTVFKNNIQFFGKDFNLEKKINKKIYDQFEVFAKEHIKNLNENINSDTMKLSNLTDTSAKQGNDYGTLAGLLRDLNEQLPKSKDEDVKEKIRRIVRTLSDDEVTKKYFEVI